MVKLAILTPSNNAYSETYIKAHIDKLKANTLVYFGNYVPIFKNDDTHKLNLPFILKLFYRLLGKLIGVENLDYQKALIQSWKEEKVDVILAEYGVTAAKSLYAIKKSKIPLLIHFHGYDASHYQVLEQNKKAYLEMFQYATSVFSVSAFMTEQLLKLGCPKDKIIYNPYGPNAFFDLENEALNRDNHSFIAVGRFCDKKNPKALIESFSLVIKEYPQVSLNMIGKGDLFEEVENYIKELGLENNINLLGVKNSNEIREYFKNSFAFVQHSVRDTNGDAEGTPVAILEASLSGLPIISTRHSGIIDAVKEGETGLLSDEHDVIQFAKNIVFFIEHKDKALLFGKNAKKHILENYRLEKHLELIDQAILNA